MRKAVANRLSQIRAAKTLRILNINDGNTSTACRSRLHGAGYCFVFFVRELNTSKLPSVFAVNFR